MRLKQFLGILLVAGALVHCGRAVDSSSDLTVKPITKEQALADLAQMESLFEGLYGPMEYKSRHSFVKLDFAKNLADAKAEIAAAKSEADIYAAFTRFVMKFKDGHVSISFDLSSEHVNRYEIPLFVMPVKDENGEWKAIVDYVDSSLADSGIKQGDIILSVDGKNIFDYLPTINKYKTYSNPVSDRQLIYLVFRRPFYMTELVPNKVLAEIVFQHEGETAHQYTSLAWKKITDAGSADDFVIPTKARSFYVEQAIDHNAQAGASLHKMGALTSFFYTDKARAKFNFKQRAPSEESLKKFGLKKEEAAPVFAFTYEYDGKDILVVRQPGYIPPFEGNRNDYELLLKHVDLWINTYKAVLYENQDVDVLIVDQTHNPGGLSQYVFDFFRLFIDAPKASLIQHNNVDRLWVLSYLEEAARLEKLGRIAEARRNRAFARMIEEADERGDLLSAPVTFDYDYKLNPHKDFSWKKPILVLADELAGSCGDIFPMLMQRNGVAKIFGERTMGLGGNVEAFDLTYSRAKVRLTRGLFTTFNEDGQYPDELYIENNGVTPDTHFEHSLDDVRAGYVGYVEAFSKAAIAQEK